MADLLETPGEKQVRILGNSSPSFKSIPLSFTWLVHALVESDTRTEVCFFWVHRTVFVQYYMSSSVLLSIFLIINHR